MRVVDLSAYTGELSPRSVDAMKQDGVEMVGVQGYGGGPTGLGPNPYARQQATIVLNAGLRVMTYSWPPYGWQAALQNLDGFPVEALGLDIEAGVQMTREQVVGVRQYTRCLKYASLHTWRTDMGNSSAFADVDTWLAYYLQRGWPTWEAVSGLALPDGSRTAMVQVQGTTTLGDDQFDLNVADPMYFMENDMATTEERLTSLEYDRTVMSEQIRVLGERVTSLEDSRTVLSAQVEHANTRIDDLEEDAFVPDHEHKEVIYR
jgi:hypothetical protein